jgi:hypothetical protein
MDAISIERIETGAERGASALFGAAVGYAVYGWLSVAAAQPLLGACAGGAGAAAYWLCSRSLAAAVQQTRRQFTLPAFVVPEPQWPAAVEDLVLTDADRLSAAQDISSAEPLVLDDVLAEIGPEARVVRLFDPKRMPTPGQLKSRIDDHLGQGSAADGPIDASQALSDALAELKRSLR